MRKALLLYNPLSGGRRHRRLKDVRAAAAVLAAAGIEVSVDATRSPEGAAQQTQEAIRSGCDTVFACGGDGTVNDVLQGMVGSRAALGVIPLGTANTLAHDLGLPGSPVRAARVALISKPRRIAIGRLNYRDFSDGPGERYFTVTAGIGIDALLFQGLQRSAKDRMGMAAYYARATRLWLTHRGQYFDVKFAAIGQPMRSEQVTQLLGVRIGNFGGILRRLAPGASLLRNDLRLVLFKTRKRSSYLLYVLGCMCGQSWNPPGIELEFADWTACEAVGAPQAEKIYVQADGELLGCLPAEISLVHDALTILMPDSAPLPPREERNPAAP